MGLQRKTGAGIKTQAWEPYQGGPLSFGVLLSAMQLRQQERLCLEEKGRKDSCWWALRRCHMALD